MRHKGREFDMLALGDSEWSLIEASFSNKGRRRWLRKLSSDLFSGWEGVCCSLMTFSKQHVLRRVFPFFENRRGIPYPSIWYLHINGETLIAPTNMKTLQLVQVSPLPSLLSCDIVLLITPFFLCSGTNSNIWALSFII